MEWFHTSRTTARSSPAHLTQNFPRLIDFVGYLCGECAGSLRAVCPPYPSGREALWGLPSQFDSLLAGAELLTFAYPPFPSSDLPRFFAETPFPMILHINALTRVSRRSSPAPNWRCRSRIPHPDAIRGVHACGLIRHVVDGILCAKQIHIIGRLCRTLGPCADWYPCGTRENATGRHPFDTPGRSRRRGTWLTPLTWDNPTGLGSAKLKRL